MSSHKFIGNEFESSINWDGNNLDDEKIDGILSSLTSSNAELREHKTNRVNIIRAHILITKSTFRDNLSKSYAEGGAGR